MAGSAMTFTYDDGVDASGRRGNIRKVIADWVSDLERATRYLYSHGAAGLAERLSREHGVEAAAVREIDVC